MTKPLFYVFQAANLCDECGSVACQDTPMPEGVKREPDGELIETSYDSDDYPKGPYPRMMGEADSPQHCDHCGMFLKNPLTSDGVDYVRGALADGGGNPEVLAEWASYYGLEAASR